MVGYNNGMARSKAEASVADDVEAVADAVLTASRLLIAVSARSIAAVDDSITLPQFRLLVLLHSRGPQKVTALAEALGVYPSSVTRAIDRLLATGLVDRQVNPESRREMQISLTRTGRRVVREVTGHRKREIAQIIERMPVTHRRGLVRALTAFSQAGGEPPASNSAYAVDDTDWA